MSATGRSNLKLLGPPERQGGRGAIKSFPMNSFRTLIRSCYLLNYLLIVYGKTFDQRKQNMEALLRMFKGREFQLVGAATAKLENQIQSKRVQTRETQ